MKSFVEHLRERKGLYEKYLVKTNESSTSFRSVELLEDVETEDYELYHLRFMSGKVRDCDEWYLASEIKTWEYVATLAADPIDAPIYS